MHVEFPLFVEDVNVIVDGSASPLVRKCRIAHVHYTGIIPPMLKQKLMVWNMVRKSTVKILGYEDAKIGDNIRLKVRFSRQHHYVEYDIDFVITETIFSVKEGDIDDGYSNRSNMSISDPQLRFRCLNRFLCKSLNISH